MNSPDKPTRGQPAPVTVISLLLAVWLVSGCVALGVPVAGDPAPAVDAGTRIAAAGETAGSADGDAGDAMVAAVELDPELIFDYLLTDIAERRGDPATSLQAAVRLAQRTRHSDLILRAFRLAMRAGQADTALAMADLMREAGVDALRVTFARVQAHLISEQPERAVDEVLGLLAEQPGQRETAFNTIGEIYARQPNPEDHLESIRKMADAYPDDPHGYFALAYVANRAREFDVLDEAVSRTLELAPHWERAAVVKFAYLVQIGDRDAAQAFADDYLEHNPDALDLAERHARLLASQGQLDSAERWFRRILDEQPDNSDVMMALALVSMQKEDWSGARHLLHRHLRLDPGNDETRMRLALVAQERGRFEEAIDWYSEVRTDALVFDAQLRIANVLEQSAGGEAALEHLRGLSPSSRDEEIDVILSQERILRRMNRLDDAYTLVDAAVQDMPDHGDLLYSRALLAAQRNDLGRHEQDIRRVIELEPDNAHAYNALGYTLADQTDRFEEALELIVQALELAPEDPFILDSMGWVQYRLGHHDVAEEYLRRALSIRHDAEIAAHLGEVLWVSGVRAEAEEIWEAALSEDPDNETLLDTLERLKPR